MFFSIIPSLQIYTIARRADHPPSGKPWLGGVMAHLLGQCVKRGNMIAQPSQPPKMGCDANTDSFVQCQTSFGSHEIPIISQQSRNRHGLISPWHPKERS